MLRSALEGRAWQLASVAAGALAGRSPSETWAVSAPAPRVSVTNREVQLAVAASLTRPLGAGQVVVSTSGK
jgi:hypothetical protein